METILALLEKGIISCQEARLLILNLPIQNDINPDDIDPAEPQHVLPTLFGNNENTTRSMDELE